MNQWMEQPYHLQEPRVSFWNPSQIKQSLILLIDIALDAKDRFWFMELTTRLNQIIETEARVMANRKKKTC